MKKSKFIMIMFFLVCFSCQNKTGDDENKVCKVNDPLTDLPWLKEVMINGKNPDIIITEYLNVLIRMAQVRAEPVLLWNHVQVA